MPVRNDAAAASEDWWQQVSLEGGAAERATLTPDVNMLGGDAGNFDGDDLPTTSTRSMKVQQKLSALIDKAKIDHLVALLDEDNVEDSLRLQELRDEHQDHCWMWCLNPNLDPVLPEADWIREVRLRLGGAQLSTDVLCASCGERVLDKNGYHALCCAKGESTRGHNKVRGVLHAGFAASDLGANAEVLGLIPTAPDLRPADILTNAAQPNRLTAVDVGIAAPHASGAGDDCLESMRHEKFRKYERHLPELEAEGIEYFPAPVSAYGRRHPCVTKMMTLAARAAARRRGFGDHGAMLRRWNRALSCEVWRRASRMLLACMPKEPRCTSYVTAG